MALLKVEVVRASDMSEALAGALKSVFTEAMLPGGGDELHPVVRRFLKGRIKSESVITVTSRPILRLGLVTLHAALSTCHVTAVVGQCPLQTVPCVITKIHIKI
jgi:hypothetical protein